MPAARPPIPPPITSALGITHCKRNPVTLRWMEIRRIGIIGAGTMGNGIAQVFAQSGFEVRLVDAVAPALDRAKATIEKSLGKFVEKGKMTAADRDAAAGRLSTGTDLGVLADADFVVEAIVEQVDTKRDLDRKSVG